MKTLEPLVVSAILLAGFGGVASAQDAEERKPRRIPVEVSGSALWTAGQDLPGRAATLTGNPSTGSGSLDLFSSAPALDPVIGAQGVVTVHLTRAFAIEGAVQFSRPQLTVRLSDDFEGAGDVTAASTITEYLFSGSLVYHFGAAGRGRPFIAAGAGHLRDVHAGNELVETGVEYHGKAGYKLSFGAGQKTLGLRAEAGISVRDGGFSFDDGIRTVPIASIGLFYAF